MAKDLTKIALDNLKPGAARREVPDGHTRGLFLIVQPTGAKSWAVRYRFNGRPKKLTIGTFPGIDLKAARGLAGTALKSIASGEDPAATKKATKVAARTPDDRDLVEKVVAVFIERYVKPNQRSKTAYETERVLNKEVVSAWKGRRLSSIGRAEIHDLLDEIVDRGAPIMANRALAALRKMCVWAVDRGLIETSPCERVRAPAAERSRDRVLSDEELKTVWQACDDLGWPFGQLVRLLVLTGQRRDEVASMHWSEIDIEGRTWTLPRERSKNDQAHVVPLSEPAIAILSALPKVASKAGYVFTTNGRAPVSGFAKVKERLDALMLKAMRKGAVEPDKIELPRWTLHDLRRTFASGAARLGIAPHIVEAVLNHKSGQIRGVSAVYNRHSYGPEKRVALEEWARFVETLVGGAPAANVIELKARG